VPIYEYKCLTCNEITDAFRRVADRDIPPPCDHCEGDTKKIISAYRTHSDLTPYFDENLETFIQSKQHRKTVMQAQGVSENYGQGWYTSARKERR